jgi:hypothetical protein
MTLHAHSYLRRAVVAVGALAVGATAACGGSGDITMSKRSSTSDTPAAAAAGQPAPAGVLASLRQSADDTTKATSGRYSLTFGKDGASPVMTVNGEFNDHATHQTTSADASSLGGKAEIGDIEMITDGEKMYLRGSLFGGADAAADTWHEFAIPGGDLSMARDALGTQGGVQTVRLLDGAYGDVTDLGAETVRGASTKHYRVGVDLGKVAAGTGLFSQGASGTYPLDVWVGDDGLVHKMQFSIADVASSVIGAGGADELGDAAHMITTFELWDVGADVAITAPADAQPLDLSDVLGGLGGH